MIDSSYTTIYFYLSYLISMIFDRSFLIYAVSTLLEHIWHILVSDMTICSPNSGNPVSANAVIFDSDEESA